MQGIFSVGNTVGIGLSRGFAVAETFGPRIALTTLSPVNTFRPVGTLMFTGLLVNAPPGVEIASVTATDDAGGMIDVALVGQEIRGTLADPSLAYCPVVLYSEASDRVFYNAETGKAFYLGA